MSVAHNATNYAVMEAVLIVSSLLHEHYSTLLLAKDTHA